MKKILIYIIFTSVLFLSNSLVFATEQQSTVSITDYLNNYLVTSQIYNVPASPTYITGSREEYVSPQSRELSTAYVDYALPGRNGLDLEIKRIYKQGSVDSESLKVELINGVLVEQYSSIPVCNDSFYEKRYNLGQGWRFSFPTIEIRKNELNPNDPNSIEDYKFLHTESGDVYSLSEPTTIDGKVTYTIRGNSLKQVTIIEDNSFSNGQTDGISKYVMTDKNGKKTYFSEDGRILGIQDRYSNLIKFEYSDLRFLDSSTIVTQRLISKITDTVGRVVIIEYIQGIKDSAGVYDNQTAELNGNKLFSVLIKVPSEQQGINDHVIEYSKVGCQSGSSGTYTKMYLSIVKDHGRMTYEYCYEYEYFGLTYLNGMNMKYISTKFVPILLTAYIYIEDSDTIIKEYSYEKCIRRLGYSGARESLHVSEIKDIAQGSLTVMKSKTYTINGDMYGVLYGNNFQSFPVYNSWTSYGGTWSLIEDTQIPNRYKYGVESGDGVKSIVNNSNFSDFSYEADVMISNSSSNSDAGLLFRTSNLSTGVNALNGYYVGINASNNTVVLGKMNNNWTEIARASATIGTNTLEHIKVDAYGTSIKVYIGDMTTPKIDITDSTYATGSVGVRAYQTAAQFDDIFIYNNKNDDNYLRNNYRYYTEIIDMRGVKIKYTYNGLNELVNIEEYGNDHKNISIFEYDENKLPKKTVEEIYNVVNGQAIGNPVVKIENFVYDQYGNLLQYTGPEAQRDINGTPVGNENTIIYTYATGKYNVLESKTWKKDNNTTSAIEYDIAFNGNIMKEIKKHTENGTASDIVTNYQYDEYGNLTKETVNSSDNIYETNYVYGTEEDGIDRGGVVNKYNGIYYGGAYLTREYSIKDNVEFSKKYVYDFYTGIKIQEYDHNNHKTTYQYDVSNRLEKILYDDTTTKSYAYSTYFENPYPDEYTAMEVKYTDQKGQEFLYEYNIFGNTVQISIRENNLWKRIKTYRYDSNSNKTKEIDSRGHSIRYDYDSENRLIKKSYWDNDMTEKESLSLGYSYYKTYKYDYSQNQTSTWHGFDLTVDTNKTYTYSFDAYISPDANIPSTGNTFIANGEYGFSCSFNYDNTKKGTWQHFEYTAKPTSTIARILLYPTTGSSPAITGHILYRNVEFMENGSKANQFTQPDTNEGFTMRGNGIFTVVSQNYLLTITDEEGYIKKNHYDINNRLQMLQVTPDNSTWYYTTYTYDYAGNKTAETDGRNNETTYVYDDLNRIISVKDALNNETKYTYNSLNKVLVKEEPGQKATQYSYDVLGRITTQKLYKAGEGATNYQYNKYPEYDAEGKVKKRVEGSFSNNVDNISSITTYNYNNMDRLVDEYRWNDIAGTSKSYIKYEYDNNGNTTAKIEYANTAQTKYIKINYRYDFANMLISEEGFVEDGTEQRGYYNKVLERDYEGNIKNENTYKGVDTSNNPLYYVTSYTYDHRNRVNSKKEPYSTGEATKVTSFTYDKRGGSVKTQTIAKQGEQCVIEYNYDGMGNLTRLTDEMGNTTRYVYNANGNKIKEIDPRYYSKAAEQQNPSIVNTASRIEYEYDALNRPFRVTAVESGVSTVISYMEYDGRGNVIKQVDGERYNPSNPTVSIGNIYEYDVADRIVKFTSAAMVKYNKDNNASKFSKIYTYDGCDRVLTEVDALGRIISSVYYLDGKLKERIYPDDATKKESYTYDLTRKLELVKNDRKGNPPTKYFNNIFGKPYRIEYPDGTYETFEYDNRGLVTASYDRKANRIDYGYDNCGNLSREKVWVNVKTIREWKVFRWVTYTYDYYRLVEWTYDEANSLLTKETFMVTKDRATGSETQQTINDEVTYIYNRACKLMEVNGPNGRQVKYDYDAKGNLKTQLSKETDAGNYSVKQFEYDLLSRLKAETILVEESDIDPAKLNGAEHDTEYTTKVKRTITYDYYKNGKLKNRKDMYNNAESYEYDYDGRVTKTVDAKVKPTFYEYDLNGNLFKVTNARNITVEYNYDELNRLIRKKVPLEDGTQSITRYVYDGLGNLIREIAPKSYDASKDTSVLVNTMPGTTYGYDSMNRLEWVKSSEDKFIEYRIYDGNGNVVKVVDGIRYNGDVNASLGTSSLYDGINRLVKVTDPLNQSISYEYDILGNITKLTDKRGITTTYEYYPDSTLKKVLFADTGFIEYTYNKIGQKLTEKDQRGNTTSYEYNALGSIRKVTDPYTNTIENKYDLNGNVTKVKDKRDNTSLFSYDANNRLIEKRVPLEEVNNVTVYAVEGYLYDDVGNILKHTATGTKEPGSIRETTFTYYYNNLVNTVSDNSGRSSKSYYDKNGNLIRTEVARDTNEYDITLYEYDVCNRLIKSIQLVDESHLYNAANLPNITALRSEGKIQLITGYEYDQLGNVKKTMDPRAYGYVETDEANRASYTITYSYDTLNRLDKVTGKHDGADVYTQYSYDTAGNKQWERNERGNYTLYSYDNMNRLKSITYPELVDQTRINDAAYINDTARKTSIKYEYDKAGNKIGETDAKDNKMSYIYDSLNRLETIVDAYSKVISKNLYDANGNITKNMDAKGYLSGATDVTRYGTEYIYDLANRLTSVLDPEGKVKGLTFTVKYEYNQYGETTKQTDALNNETKYEYNNAGQLIKVTDPIPVDTIYTYDKTGNKRTMTNGKLKVTGFGYGAFGILVSYTNPENKSMDYKYDLTLNRVRVLDMNGNETLYTYNNHSRMLTREVTQTGDRVSYTYDEAGNRKTLSDTGGTSVYGYDKNNRLLNISRNSAVQVGYTYDDVGNIVTVTDKKGFVTTYGYDNSNRMQTVTFSGKTTTYTYDANGNRESVAYQGGVKESYVYDKNNRLLTLENKKPDGSILSIYAYTYYDNGLEKTKTDLFGVTTYTYDKVGRITNVASPGKTSIYSYDYAGNRQSLSETYTSDQPSGYIDEAGGNEIQYRIKSSEYVYSDSNKLLKVVEIMKSLAGVELLQKTVSYTYDNNGNQTFQNADYLAPSTGKPESYSVFAYPDQTAGTFDNRVDLSWNEYDGFNRLRKVESINKGSKTLVEYTYNGDDLRISKITKKSSNNYTPEQTNYLYDRQHVILETDAADDVKVRYVRGINYIARLAGANELSYFLYNGHGDVVQTANEAGVVENRYEYDIFGNTVLAINGAQATSEVYNCAIRYSGEFYDSETGMYYLRARYYDPYIGRFVSEDSYWGEDENPLSLNLYTYAHNNPIMYIDPSGHIVTEWDRERLSSVEIMLLEYITQQWLDYDTKGDQGAKDALHNMAEVIRDQYRSSDEVGSDTGYTYVVSNGSTSLYEKDAESLDSRVQEVILQEDKLIPVYSGVDGHMVMINAGEVDQWRSVNWNTTGETVLMYSGVDGHAIEVDAADIKQRITENWLSGYQTTTMYSTSDGAALQNVYGWQIADFVNNNEYYTGYQTITVRSTTGKDKGQEYNVWAWEVWELGQSGNFETSAMQGWREHNEAVEAARQAEIARQTEITRQIELIRQAEAVSSANYNKINNINYYKNHNYGADNDTEGTGKTEGMGKISTSDLAFQVRYMSDESFRNKFDSSFKQEYGTDWRLEGYKNILTGNNTLQPNDPKNQIAYLQGKYEAIVGIIGTSAYAGAGIYAAATSATAATISGTTAIAVEQKLADASQKTYFQTTSKEAAQIVQQTGKLAGKEFSNVFAFTQQPTLNQAMNSGARYTETVIQFETKAGFQIDKTVDKSLQAIARMSVGNGPINVSNIQEVGFKQTWVDKIVNLFK